MRFGPRGLSLAETLIALFILAVGGLTCVGLLLTSLRHQSDSQRATRAARLGDKVLARVRHEASDASRFSSWQVYDDDHFVDPDEPEFRIHVRSSPLEPACSPCSSLEAGTAGRRLDRCQRRVEIHIAWGRREHRLATCVYPGKTGLRRPTPLTVTRSSDTNLAAGAWVRLEGHLFAQDGQEIRGVPFEWNQISRDYSGIGTLERGLDGSEKTVRLYNLCYAGDPASDPPITVPGRILVSCRARYGGVYYAANSTEISLDAP